MTNSTDILLVGGAANGMMVCINRTKPAPIYPVSVAGVGTVNYIKRAWTHPDTGNNYWVAFEDGVLPPTDDDVRFEIVRAGFQPAWDLRS